MSIRLPRCILLKSSFQMRICADLQSALNYSSDSFARAFQRCLRHAFLKILRQEGPTGLQRSHSKSDRDCAICCDQLLANDMVKKGKIYKKEDRQHCNHSKRVIGWCDLEQCYISIGSGLKHMQIGESWCKDLRAYWRIMVSGAYTEDWSRAA